MTADFDEPAPTKQEVLRKPFLNMLQRNIKRVKEISNIEVRIFSTKQKLFI